MAPVKLLLVDDEAVLRLTLSKILEHHNFQVTTAANAAEAIVRINEDKFDVLLSDLHMPNAGDGLTVVSAMRHSNPDAVTMLFSAYPAMTAAANAILLQADEILVKPLSVEDLVTAIRQRLLVGPSKVREVESVATILERTSEEVITSWLALVRLEPTLTAIPITDAVRTQHLPQLVKDLVVRLRSFTTLGAKDLKSVAARDHGLARRHQGSTAAMIVEESRILQVCIFHTLQDNIANIDFSILLIGVMTIADEVDSQLSQAMSSYLEEPLVNPQPLVSAA